MKLSRVAIYVTAAILVVAAVGAGVATAHKKKIKTTVTIQWSDNDDPYDATGETFSGDVGSKKKKCRKGRQVTVKEQGGENVGTDKTNKQGQYRIVVGNADSGAYFAKVKKKVIKKNQNHKHVCKKGRSDTISVP